MRVVEDVSEVTSPSNSKLLNIINIKSLYTAIFDVQTAEIAIYL